MEKMTAAHRTLPFGAMVRVTNQNNRKAVEVRITDRGPFVDGRVIDLSKAAARQIELIGPGVAKVKLVLLGYSDKTPPAPAPPPVVLVKAKKPAPPSPVTAPTPAPSIPAAVPPVPAPDSSMPDEAAAQSSPASNPSSTPASDSPQSLEPPAQDTEFPSPATPPASGTSAPPASPASAPAAAATAASPMTTPSSNATTLPSSAPALPAAVPVPSATAQRVPAVSPVPLSDPLENGQFAVQVGAFRDRARAEQLQRSLSARYAPVQLISRDAGYTVWRVLVGRKNSLEEANALAAVLKPVTGAAFVVRLDQ